MGFFTPALAHADPSLTDVMWTLGGIPAAVATVVLAFPATTFARRPMSSRTAVLKHAAFGVPLSFAAGFALWSALLLLGNDLWPGETYQHFIPDPLYSACVRGANAVELAVLGALFGRVPRHPERSAADARNDRWLSLGCFALAIVLALFVVKAVVVDLVMASPSDAPPI